MIIPIWALYIIYAFIRPRPHIALICASLGSVLLNALRAAFLALIGLRRHAPLLDSTLAQADEFIGFNAPAIIKFCSFHPKFSNFLRIFYISCPLFPLVIIIYFSIRKNTKKLWQSCFIFGAGAITCALFNSFAPAEATVQFYHIPLSIIQKLPQGSGTFFHDAFRSYYDRKMDHIGLSNMEGVVTFPSFHAVMAIFVFYFLKDIYFIKYLAFLYCLIVLFLTIPIGGHYSIDIWGGRNRLLYSGFFSTKIRTNDIPV